VSSEIAVLPGATKTGRKKSVMVMERRCGFYSRCGPGCEFVLLASSEPLALTQDGKPEFVRECVRSSPGPSPQHQRPHQQEALPATPAH
jgi:hypothetical protein